MALPEKPHFTLDEIVERWKGYGCDREALLEYARQDALVFAVYTPHIGAHRTRRETETSILTKEVSTFLEFMTEEAAEQRKLPLRYISSEDATRILSAPAGVEIAVNVLFLRPERVPKRDGHAYAQAKYFTAADLRISRAERDRFEEAHDLDIATGTPGHALVRVLRICRQFPRVVDTLKDRYGNREKLFSPADEYDMQDLMRALLAVDFNDVRPEDTVPRHAGRRPRIDFILAEAKIALELKMTREGLRDKEVGDELAQDIERYRSHPKCKTLVCVVYDPQGLIRNPVEIQTSLSGPRVGYEVEVLVVR